MAADRAHRDEVRGDPRLHRLLPDAGRVRFGQRRTHARRWFEGHCRAYRGSKGRHGPSRPPSRRTRSRAVAGTHLFCLLRSGPGDGRRRGRALDVGLPGGAPAQRLHAEASRRRCSSPYPMGGRGRPRNGHRSRRRCWALPRVHRCARRAYAGQVAELSGAASLERRMFDVEWRKAADRSARIGGSSTSMRADPRRCTVAAGGRARAYTV